MVYVRKILVLSNMDVWVLIPAYNEEETLGPLIKKLKEEKLSVLVVDDGSVDNTARIAEENGAVLLRNGKNSGKGVSLKKGIAYLLGQRHFDYVLIMDGDGQHAPSDTEKFLKEAERGKPCVIGNRMDNPLGMPALRIFTNKFMSWLISRITQQHIPDSQCGFRLIKRKLLEQITIHTDNYQIESEILIKVARQGTPIKSIPVKSIYHKNSKSKIRPIIDTCRFVKFIFSLNGQM